MPRSNPRVDMADVELLISKLSVEQCRKLQAGIKAGVVKQAKIQELIRLVKDQERAEKESAEPAGAVREKKQRTYGKLALKSVAMCIELFGEHKQVVDGKKPEWLWPLSKAIYDVAKGVD